MFGQSSGFGFGQSQPQASPFGAAPATSNPFGGGLFGQQQPQAQASPFGAAAPTGGLFGGAAAAPAFGQASTPAFGAAAAAPAFGSTAFGAARPAGGFGGFGAPATGFGAASAPAFGAASTPAFGAAASTPTFGLSSAPSFGAMPGAGFGASAPAFGAAAASAPMFGAAASSPAFGAPAASPFGGGGTSLFGAAATAPAFGAAPAASPFGAAPAASPFGAAPGGAAMFGAAPSAGTRHMAYQKTNDKDSSAQGGAGVQVTFNSISAMPQYQTKSHEELRWEDYQAGVKSAAAGPPPAAATGFGTPAPASTGLFGAAASPTSPFGAAPSSGGGLFGAAAPATSPFGAPAVPAFGAASAAPAFGAASAPAASPFGTATTAFGQAPASSSPFGAPAAGFGTTTAGTSLFGAQPAASVPAFGAATGGLFGSSAPAFGAAAATPAASSPFGAGFGAAASPFGASSAPAFGAAAPAASPFGAATTAASPFGAPAAAPAASPFGAATPGTSLFGSTTTGTGFGAGAFGAKPASTPAFGAAASAPAFGAAAPATGGLFGSAFGTGAFGAPAAGAPASAPAFSFASAATSSPFPALGAAASPFGTTTTTGGLFGQPAATGVLGGALVPAASPAGVGQAPYGALPQLPQVPEPKVGISQRPMKLTVNVARQSPLLAIKSTTPRFGLQVRPPPPAAAGAATLGGVPLGATSSTDGAGGSGSSPLAILPARENPHRLFIRAPPPSTESVLTPSSTPSKGPGSGAAANGGDKSAPGSGAAANGGAYQRTPANGDRQQASDQQQQAGGSGSQQRGSPTRRAGGGGGASSSSGHLPHLGRLADEGYTIEPSLSQLEAMYRDSPASLRRVSNFTVGRATSSGPVGQIRWLRPVDVTGLHLEEVVAINEGEVAVYLSAEKPPVGQGLNTDAEVTLHGVYKRDKETGEPTRNPQKVARFERSLREYCAQQDARFLSYKPDGGVWKFEVEHFSRYGLPTGSDSDDDDDGDGAAQAGGGGGGGSDASGGMPGPPLVGGGLAGWGKGKRLATGAAVGAPVEGPASSAAAELSFLGGDAGDSEGGDAEALSAPADGLTRRGGSPGGGGGSDVQLNAQTDSEDLDMVVVGGGGMAEGGAFARPSAPLQHSLPAQLGLDAGQLMAMREAFFPDSVVMGGAAGGGSDVDMDVAAAGAALLRAPPQASGRAAPRASSQFAQASAAPGRPVLHNWRQAAAPPITAATSQKLSQLQPTPPPPAVPLIGSPSFVPPPSPPGGSLLDDPRATGNVVDAGVFMGRSTRVGWAPDGTLARAELGPGGVGSVVTLKPLNVVHAGSDDVIEQTPAEAAAALQRLRGKLLAALRLHCRLSSPDDGDDGGSGAQQQQQQSGVPRWRLRCTPRSLPQLCAQFASCCEQQLAAAQAPALSGGGASSSNSLVAAAAAAGGGGGSSTAAAAQYVDDTEVAGFSHEVDTWRLIDALYGHIDAADDTAEGAVRGGGSGGALMRMGSGDDGPIPMATLADEDGADDDGPGGQHAMLVSFKRRAALSRWLQHQAGGYVEAAMTSSRPGSRLQLLGQLLSGHQLAAAAAVAVALGDVRLATLIAQAGAHSAASQELAQQLQVWQTSGLDAPKTITPDRLAIYQILAGRIHDVQPAMQLDWRRFLAMCLWYESSALTPASDVLLKYAAEVADAAAQQALGGSAAVAPHPVPRYAELDGGAAAATAVSGGGAGGRVTDLHYELLQLWARGDQQQQQQAAAASDMDADGDGWGPADDATSSSSSHGASERLLRSAGYSPNPLDYSLSWLVMTCLEAIGALALRDPATGEPHAPALSVALSLIAQIQAVGGMCEWAIYVALHIPDLPSWPGLRHRLVAGLLAQHCPEWCEDDGCCEFLARTLRLPAALLGEARATWARYSRNSLAECRALLAAGDAAAAHQLLTAVVGPNLFLSKRFGELRQLLDALQPHRQQLGPDWPLGAGLYLLHLQLFSPQLAMAGGGAGAMAPAALRQLLDGAQQLSRQVVAASEALARQRQQQQQRPSDVEQQAALVKQQLALSRMADAAANALMFQCATAAGQPRASADAARARETAVAAVADMRPMPSDTAAFAANAGMAELAALVTA